MPIENTFFRRSYYKKIINNSYEKQLERVREVATVYPGYTAEIDVFLDKSIGYRGVFGKIKGDFSLFDDKKTRSLLIRAILEYKLYDEKLEYIEEFMYYLKWLSEESMDIDYRFLIDVASFCGKKIISLETLTDIGGSYLYNKGLYKGDYSFCIFKLKACGLCIEEHKAFKDKIGNVFYLTVEDIVKYPTQRELVEYVDTLEYA